MRSVRFESSTTSTPSSFSGKRTNQFEYMWPRSWRMCSAFVMRTVACRKHDGVAGSLPQDTADRKRARNSSAVNPLRSGGLRSATGFSPTRRIL